MYKNKLVVCIKVNEKILKEEGNQVFLPYNTKYSVFIKNENNVPAIIKYDFDSDILETKMNIQAKSKKEINIDTNNNSLELNKGKKEKLTVKFGFIDENNLDLNLEHEIILKLSGSKANKQIDSIKTTKDKKVCLTCNKQFKYKYNFCPYDGNFLNDL